jgi:hypothetical protein
MQNTVFAILGFFFWLALGCVSIKDADRYGVISDSGASISDYEKKMKAVGRLDYTCIL